VILRRLIPGPVEEIDDHAPGARDRLLDWYSPAEAAGIRINLVMTIDGRIAGGDGTSDSLSSRTDRMILGVIREPSDVVVVGAGTVRAEGYRLPSRAPLAIVSASGNLDGHRLAPREGAPPVLVLTTASGAAHADAALAHLDHRCIVVADGPGPFPIADAVNALRERGMTSIVVEGGPSLVHALIVEQLIDELCITTVPRLGGRALPFLGVMDAPLSDWHRTQLIVDAQELTYARWSRVVAPS